MKTCTRCSALRPLTEYYIRKSVSTPDNIKYVSRCKQCVLELDREFKERLRSDPELKAKHAATRRKRRTNPTVRATRNEQQKRHVQTALAKNPYYVRAKAWKKYGLDPAEVISYIEMHDGTCDICGDIPKRTLHVDHCHDSNKFRGLLCDNCNHLLGKAKDSQRILVAAIHYLNNRN